ncbi:Hypothetical predicted protein [Octopus vulgaris]|uniref:Uncharacterized protein n=1 Tax=Octopus vulgaris TaxID=6645 RepID=A0AA36B944_OCTVU|nr:Hypothetical predicted protein [Octopus vulgaris]
MRLCYYCIRCGVSYEDNGAGYCMVVNKFVGDSRCSISVSSSSKRGTRCSTCGGCFIGHATENDINIRHKGKEESDEQYSPPRGLIERLPPDQSTQRPEDTRNSIVPVKDSQENEKTTVTEDLAFAEKHRESMAEMRQKILNTLEVIGIPNTYDINKCSIDSTRSSQDDLCYDIRRLFSGREHI